MNIEQIIALANAGFTKDDILKMEQPTVPAQQVPTVPAVPTQQVPAVPAVPAQQVPAQQVPTVPAQQVPAVPAQQVPAVPAQQVPAVPAQQVPTVPAQQVPAVPVQTIPGRPANQADATAPLLNIIDQLQKRNLALATGGTTKEETSEDILLHMLGETGGENK